MIGGGGSGGGFGGDGGGGGKGTSLSSALPTGLADEKPSNVSLTKLVVLEVMLS